MVLHSIFEVEMGEWIAAVFIKAVSRLKRLFRFLPLLSKFWYAIIFRTDHTTGISIDGYSPQVLPETFIALIAIGVCFIPF